jgi:hypothetical protein
MTSETIFGSVRTMQRPRHGGTNYVRLGTALKQITGRLTLWRARIRARGNSAICASWMTTPCETSA